MFFLGQPPFPHGFLALLNGWYDAARRGYAVGRGSTSSATCSRPNPAAVAEWSKRCSKRLCRSLSGMTMGIMIRWVVKQHTLNICSWLKNMWKKTYGLIHSDKHGMLKEWKTIFLFSIVMGCYGFFFDGMTIGMTTSPRVGHKGGTSSLCLGWFVVPHFTKDCDHHTSYNWS